MNLPESFKAQMRPVLGDEQCESFYESLDAAPPTSIRINLFKPSVCEYAGEEVPWCRSGRCLDERPSFTLDPLFHSGAYYVQEASSMFLDWILRAFVEKPSTVLDLCAAPGGKSTLTLSALPKGSVLVANEIVRQRSQILAENIIKWGSPNAIVTNNCAADFQEVGQVFDVVICDAPCSGEGMFRKDPKAVDEWSPQNVDMCQSRQREILADIWPCLKPGGLLVYSTCTYNLKENEENVLWAVENLGAEVLDCDVPEEWGVTGNLLEGTAFPVYHFFPHKTKGEGFFACVMRKGEDCEDEMCGRARRDKKKGRDAHKEPPFPKEVKMWVDTPQQYTFLTTGAGLYAFPSAHANLLHSALSSLKVVHYGIQLATLKGKAVIPAHSLAMSVCMSKAAFPMFEVDETTALSYLRTESVVLPSDAPIGYVILSHKGSPLGFVKNIGNRANNLYPSEWRIRHAGR